MRFELLNALTHTQTHVLKHRKSIINLSKLKQATIERQEVSVMVFIHMVSNKTRTLQDIYKQNTKWKW